MLAAIGIIIIAKQIPVLLGDDPTIYKGEGPIELLMDIPRFFQYAHWHIALVGGIALLIMFTFPKIKFFKRLPAPMIVLLLAVPLGLYMHFKETEPPYSLVQIGDFWGSVGLNADFSLIGTFVFWKYVFMFLFVSSLESLLTVKAVDNLDPHKRSSDYNGDLKGQGAGNILSGLLGGLPMISEVVRSSANIGFGAVTKWSNFFHGAFLLLAMALTIPVIEMIPNAALAAMLIYAGFRLAAPREFIHAYHVGKEQLAIFLVTIAVTLLEDLLLGVACGILVKFIFHLANGAKMNELFKAKFTLETHGDETRMIVNGSAIFSNLIGFKKGLVKASDAKHLIVDLRQSKLVDHSFMSFINQQQSRAEEGGVHFEIIGLGDHRKLSNHPLATHVRPKTA
jgi:MFS superfamily sulfate permease-like transporter